MARKATRSGKSSPRAGRPTVIGDRYRLEGTYERLRRSLLQRADDGRLDRPLSYWVLPTDRRLPLAFLDRKLRDLLDLPLRDLMETQGVGQKKILGFFDLLRRADKSTSAGAGDELSTAPSAVGKLVQTAERDFDPAEVSEAVWTDWRHAIDRAGLAPVRLGRIAPSLKPLPAVIWRKSLGDYSGRTLEEIRRLKTHGEKRVNAILEVFAAAYEAVSTSVLHERLQIDIAPRFVPHLNRWLTDANSGDGSPTIEQIEASLLRPLINQIENDLDHQIARLVAERFDRDGCAPSVKQQADRMGVTRARVYQLLDECASVMEVRWPEGRWLLAPLTDRADRLNPDAAGYLHGIQLLFFPSEQRAEPLSPS